MLKIIVAIFLKEIKEIYREKVFLCFLLVPIVFFPVYNIGLSYLSLNVNNSEMKICIEDDLGLLNDFYANDESITLSNSPNPIEALKRREIDTVVKYKANEQTIELIYDSNNIFSLFKATSLGERTQKFIFNSINKNTIKCIVVNEKENADGIDKTFSIFIIPFLIIFMNLQDMEKIGNDLMSKEKENKTLEIMISTGINRTFIYISKVITLSIVSLIYCSICLLSYYFSSMQCNTEVFNYKKLIILFGVSFCLCIVFSVVIVFLSMISKNTKISQFVSGCVTSFIIMFSVIIILVRIKNEYVFSFIPIINLINIIINLFVDPNTVGLLEIFIVLIDNVVFSFSIMVLSKKYLYSEKAII